LTTTSAPSLRRSRDRALARATAAEAGVENVEFVKGYM
jgi:hypothetical protein